MLVSDIADKTLFRGLAPEALQQLAPFFAEARFRRGEAIFQQGQPAEKVFVLEQGKVVLRLKPEDGGCLTIAEIHREGVFGWSAVLGRARYTAAAVCTVEAVTLAVVGSQFRALLRSDPPLGTLLLSRLALALVGRGEGPCAGTLVRLASVIQAELARASG